MRIRSAIGLAITIITLKLLMTDVFSQFEDTLVSVLSLFHGLSAQFAASLGHV